MSLTKENKAIWIIGFDDKKEKLQNMGNQIQVSGHTKGLQYDISGKRPKDTKALQGAKRY